MTVTLNVVGIFYEEAFEFSDIGGTKTIKDLLMLAQAHPDKRVPPPGGPTPPPPVKFNFSSIDYAGKVIVNSLGAERESFNSRTGTYYDAGYYELTQTFNGSPLQPQYSVWQYYVFKDKMTRNPVPPRESFTKFVVEDGQKIVWRLISVCNRPVQPPSRFANLLLKEGFKHVAPVKTS